MGSVFLLSKNQRIRSVGTLAYLSHMGKRRAKTLAELMGTLAYQRLSILLEAGLSHDQISQLEEYFGRSEKHTIYRLCRIELSRPLNDQREVPGEAHSTIHPWA